ncbi:hypothetical protein BE21_0020 [Staphylococcus phage vB_SepS_BE21]|nr:hypothetical protein BE21_0020 [Staphylococcus phage vB_SepS_BE21]
MCKNYLTRHSVYPFALWWGIQYRSDWISVYRP